MRTSDRCASRALRVGPWGEIAQALETGESDSISGMFYPVERDMAVDFSPPYAIGHHVILVRRGRFAT